jgi:ADP-ribosyl-[dinitrogen reductase] hydrolase
MLDYERACIGCLVGTAVGDALGLPYEGLSPRRAAQVFPDRDRHHFVFRRGMVSDDTDHAVMTARALLAAPDDAPAFQLRLAKSMRWWFAALPAGVGFATARAILKLWLGVPPSRSGVFSAGNGPAMRSPILGIVYGNDRDLLREYVRRSTEITHRDPKAFHGAMAIAIAAHHSATAEGSSSDAYLHAVTEGLRQDEAGELLDLLRRAVTSAAHGDSAETFAAELGLKKGVTGYMLHTVPCVVQTWLRHPDNFAAGVRDIINAGGDTDTTAAILGGILGARVGKAGIPEPWLNGIWEWPRSVAWLEELGRRLAKGADEEHPAPPAYFAPGILARNALFLVLVLAHGFRRLAPPY